MNAVLEYIKANAGATKASITEGTGGTIKGLQLHNILKKAVNEGQVMVTGDGGHATYSIVELASEETAVTNDTNGQKQFGEQMANTTEGQSENQPLAETNGNNKSKEERVAKTSTTRNNNKYSFMGQELGKGTLCRELIRHIAQKGITFKRLKEMFPDDLIPRFGVFQDVEKAREISGQKYDRYFFKESDVIKLKDKNVVCTNQLTLPLIEKIIARAKELGYEIK